MIIKETKRHPYSLHLIHWLFQYTFFFIAPLVQYLHNEFPWSYLWSTDIYMLIKVNLLIIIWQFCWLVSNKIFVNSFKNVNDKIDNKVIYSVSMWKILTLITLSILVLGFQLYIYGFGGLFIRGSEAVNPTESSTSMLIIQFSGRSIPIVLLVLLGIRRVHNKSLINNLLIFISVVLVLLTNFPTATPRFWTAAVFIGLVFTYRIFKSSNFLVYLILIGLNIIFPILATARRATTLQEYIDSLDPSRALASNLLVADYDAYSMIAYTLRYVELLGVSFGKQLTTVLLFFIPRDFWQEKSIGSGKLVAETLNFEYSNVSSPLLAEGLINFGIPGLILFAIIFSFICFKIDFSYWQSKNSFLKIIYPFWVGFFFFICRGDLLSSFSYTLGFTFCFILFKPKVIYNNEKGSVKYG